MVQKSDRDDIHKVAIKFMLAIVVTAVCWILLFPLLLSGRLNKEIEQYKKETKEMSSTSVKHLENHEGHKINIAVYDDKVVLECLDCEEELITFKDVKGNIQVSHAN